MILLNKISQDMVTYTKVNMKNIFKQKNSLSLAKMKRPLVY